MTCVDGRVFIHDLKSTNGTLLNGAPVRSPEELRHGDRIQFGTAAFTVLEQRDSRPTSTVSAEVVGEVQSYLRFERLLADRAVLPFFQPIVQLDGSHCVGYEVLSRSRLAGLESPTTMFKIASELKSEVALSCLMRREGLRLGRVLGSQAPLYLNTHPSEMGRPDLVNSLRRLRDEFPELVVVLEVHEASVMSSSSLVELQRQLDDLKIRLAYDNFGVGQDWLLYLADVPPDIIKFGMNMIRGLPEASQEKRFMVSSLVQMVRTVGGISLAEGVETPAEAAACRDMGFELAQGYFFGHPAPVTAWLPRSGPARL